MRVINIVEIILVIFLVTFLYSLLKSKRKLVIHRVAGIFMTLLIVLGHLSYGAFLEKPEIHLIGEKEVILEVNSQYEELGVKVNYHGKDLRKEIKREEKIDTNKIGTYFVTYELEFKQEKIKTVRTVKVVDTKVPEIHLKGPSELTVPENSEYEEEGYVATDNYDGDITTKVQAEKKVINDSEFEIWYVVEDSSGNRGFTSRKIKMGESIAKENKEKNGTIYLTFDDGPSLDITPKILDILKEENINATFFILNYDENREFLVKRVVKEGHSIGIHGYSHEYSQIYTSVDTYMENIRKLEEKIKQSTGVETKITRFPGGSSNTVSKYYNIGIMSKLTKILINDGYRYFDWNISSGDAGDVKTKEAVFQNVTKGFSKKKPNMVLMHDFSKNTKTLEALRGIIRYGKENGYVFEKIKEDTPMITHHVAN